MSAIALQALADETGGQLVGDSVALQTLVIDSREVKDGDLFAALSGQRVDGHDFAPQALAAGASAPKLPRTRCFAPAFTARPFSRHPIAASFA